MSVYKKQVVVESFRRMTLLNVKPARLMVSFKLRPMMFSVLPLAGMPSFTACIRRKRG